MPATLRAVSLFSNCGAGDLGFRQAGFRFSVLAEIDPRRLAVASLNHPEAATVAGDLSTTWCLVRDRYREQHGEAPLDLLAACPPCQGMSSARSGRGLGLDPEAGTRDSRNLLVVPIAKVAHALNPRVIVVENVSAFLSRLVRNPATQEPVTAALLLIRALDPQYDVFPTLIDMADYGVPQHRRRCFLTFVRRDEKYLTALRESERAPYPRPSRGGKRPHITLERAIRRMALESLDAKSPRKAKSHRRPMHEVPVWDRRRYDMVAAIPARSGKSAWENDRCPSCDFVETDGETAVCGKCGQMLLRPCVRDGRGWRLIRGFRSTSYRRMNPRNPASTVTTATGHLGSDVTLHPWENRVLSSLECADLQTIPRSFRWGNTYADYGHTFVREMIGEAVPPHFTQRHGVILAKMLRGVIDRSFLRGDDQRCTSAEDKLAIHS